MATKNVNITLEETLFEEFKDCCKNSYGLPLSIITEGLMKDFCDGEYDVIINKKGVFYYYFLLLFPNIIPTFVAP